MAFVNVLEWKAEQVADWLRGLDDVIYPYAHFFLNNNVTGQGLLNLTVDDLYKLHVEKLGHQEIVLESLELLRNFHYNLDQENLQYICLRLSCKARSLFNEMSMNLPKVGEKQVVKAPVMASVADVLDAVRLLLSWLERKPFDNAPEYHTVRTTLISHSLELATNAQRDTFAEQPMDVIRKCCDQLALLADRVIQQFTDPLILQPASLDVATVRKRADEELGIVLEPCDRVHGVHLVTETRMANPVARVERGDEIVQVNYQTVVGWQTKKVLQLMGENPMEMILTLKKRPRHSNLGQIYMKPFRIPARNKSTYSFNNLPSPRTELLVVPDVSLPIMKKRNPSESSSDNIGPLSETETDSEDDEAFLPVAASEVAGQITGIRESNASPTQSLRSVLSRPRSVPLRRATISGTSPSHFRPYINVSEIWAGLCDASSDFPSSTLSSKDSGVSTLSKGGEGGDKEYDEYKPELRRDQRRTGGSGQTPRPVTVMPSVISAPNLMRHKIDNTGDGQKYEKQEKDESESRSIGSHQHTNNGHKSRLTIPESTNESFSRQTKIISGQDKCMNSPSPNSHSSTLESQKSSGSTNSSVKYISKPKMPDPPINIHTSEPLHVSRIHVSGPVSNPAYMNVPKTPTNVPHEYVNLNSSKNDEEFQNRGHEYVNVPQAIASPSRQPLPKPRSSSIRGTTLTEGEGGILGNQESHLPERAPSEHSEKFIKPQTPISSSKTGTTGRGKRPVPLPRRLSSISTSPSEKPSRGSDQSPTSATNTRKMSNPVPTVQAGRGQSSTRRRSSTVELPAPTANFKSYRRVVNPTPGAGSVGRRASCTEEISSNNRQLIGGAGQHVSGQVNKSISMTKLTIEHKHNQQQSLSRVDSGLGFGSQHPSISSVESLRLSSVSSAESGSYCQTPTKIVPLKGLGVTPPPRGDYIKRSGTNMTPSQGNRANQSSHHELLEAEKKHRRQSGHNFLPSHNDPEYEQI